MGSSTAPFDMYSRSWLFAYPLVWAIALSGTKAMREASSKDKADIVPTPSFCFIRFHLGIGEQNLFQIWDL